jgi:hypothetical protein
VVDLVVVAAEAVVGEGEGEEVAETGDCAFFQRSTQAGSSFCTGGS